MDSKSINWTAVGWLLFLSLVAVAFSGLMGLILHTLPQHYKSAPEIALPILLSSGLIGFIATITIAVAVLAALGLSNPAHSFGMPEGTIRAVIALSLILIFAIMSIFLYQSLHNRSHTQAILTRAQFEDIPAKEILSSRPTNDKMEYFEVQRPYQNSTSVDFAKQLLTTISTLVVAIAGFYFGTQAVSVATKAVSSAQPMIRKINPDSGQQGAEFPQAEILGKNFLSPRTVKLVLTSNEAKEIIFSDLLSSPTRIQGKLSIPASQDKGPYTLIVVNSDGNEDRLANAFTVN